MATYSEDFYSTYEADSKGSAKEVLPHVINLFAPTSIVDVGCGIGTWLNIVDKLGVKHLLGIDGSYVNKEQLLFSKENFLAHDLTKPLEIPENLPQQFDLAISLEVAEHLPPEYADQCVETLTSLAPVVLFSAAIPYQGGTDHLNEQWPNYWANLFSKKGYLTVDWIRPRIWENENVSYYYAQNCLLFLQPRAIDQFDELVDYIRDPNDPTLAKVHPRKWLEANDPRKQPLKNVLAALPHSFKNAVRRRLP